MKKIVCLTLGALTAATTVQAANIYTVEPPSAGIFGKPTSVTVSVIGENVKKEEIDKSKNSALIPPRFGSHTSNLRGSGEPLTPNLATVYDGIADISATPTVTVTTTVQGNTVNIPGNIIVDNNFHYEEEAFTDVTSSMYYSGGHLGTLKIPELNLSVKIYEGTTNSVLKKGVGHFKDTSIWNGNVCVAAHNRGANDYFGEIHELDYGDEIKLTTKKGTRTYEVFSVKKISVNDTSDLQGTSDNIITMITCVKNEADYYRWCVQAIEVD